jgi:hypothetical protein
MPFSKIQFQNPLFFFDKFQNPLKKLQFWDYIISENSIIVCRYYTHYWKFNYPNLNSESKLKYI